MATKAALANGEERAAGKLTPAKRQEPNMIEKAKGVWTEFTHFLSDVRGEMRKVVTPSRKEVEATTTVVIIAVFLFGLFFFIVDNIFQFGLTELLKKLAGPQ